MRARRSLPHAIVLAGLAVLAAAQLAAAAPPAPGSGVPAIDTIAGTGKKGQADGGGTATAAEVWSVDAIASDGSGNVYFNDRYDADRPTVSNRIRKVDGAGRITTIAGGGKKILSDLQGAPATEAQLFEPSDLATDNAGNVYITDDSWPGVYPNVQTARVYKVYNDNGTSMIRTIAGGGSTPAAAGLVATEAKFQQMFSVALGPGGEVYFGADNRVWKFDPAGDNKLSIVAGTGVWNEYEPADEGKPADTVAIDSPWGMAVDSTGKVYVGGTGKHGRLRVIGGDKSIRTVACGGNKLVQNGIAATEAECEPMSIAIGPKDRPYFLGCAFYNPSEICAERSYVAALDLDKGTIAVVAGVPGKSGFSGDGGRASDALLNRPMDVAVDPSGNAYLTDRRNYRVRKVSRQAAPVAKDDAVTTESGKAATVEVLANDTGSALSVSATTKPKHGAVNTAADKKTVSYAPEAGFAGADSFEYTVTDSVGQTATAKVAATVKSVVAPPNPGPPAAGGGGQPPVPQAANAAHSSGLPVTGASVVGLMVAAGALLVLGGGLVAFTLRRRKSRR